MKVLIGIISHNYGRFIDECIQSALSQSYPCDIFVTDDGSTDDSWKRILSYKTVHFRLHADNSGDERRGFEDIIAFSKPYDYMFNFSSDDIMLPGAIEKLVRYIKHHEADWVYGGLEIIDQEGKHLGLWDYAGFPESVEEAIGYMWERRGLGTTLGSMFSTKFLEGKKMSRFPNTTFSLDASTAIDWYTSWPRIRRLDVPIVRYRQHPDSRSSKLGGLRRIMQKDLQEKMLDIFGADLITQSLRVWEEKCISMRTNL